MTDLSSDDITRLIREKMAQIERLQSELDEARNMLSAGARPKRTYHRGPLTCAEMAAQVLAERGTETHATVIVAEIERKFGALVGHSSLVGSLHRLQRDQTTFYRVGRNVYGLLEWRKSARDQG